MALAQVSVRDNSRPPDNASVAETFADKVPDFLCKGCGDSPCFRATQDELTFDLFQPTGTGSRTRSAVSMVTRGQWAPRCAAQTWPLSLTPTPPSTTPTTGPTADWPKACT